MRRLPVALLAALILFSACSHGNSPSARRAGAGGAPSGEQAKRGGVLRLGVTGLASLDPAQARGVDQQLVVDQLYDGLTTLDAGSGLPKPALASRWARTADQRTWQFTLRQGSRFSDGRPVTAADVKWSLERVARFGSGSPGADLLAPVSGWAAFAQQGTATELAGVTAPAADTVRIVLDQPLAELASLLAQPVFGVVERAAVEKAAAGGVFPDPPVTSGPFTADRRRGNVTPLRRAAGGAALLDGIDVVSEPNLANSYRAFRRGELDWVQVPADELGDAAARYGRRAFRPYVAELFYGLNVRDPRLADRRVREAILHAVDRTAIMAAVYGGAVRPLDGIVADGSTAHQSDPCGVLCSHDVDRAKELVREVFGDTPVPPLEIAFDDDVAQAAVARAIQACMAEAGIPATLSAKPLKEYKDFAVSGHQQLFRLGWVARYPSADDFLPPLFTTGSPNNLTGYSSPAVDQLLGAARAEGNTMRRNELFQRAERQVLADVTVLPLAQFELHVVTSSRLRSLAMSSTGTFDGTAVWLAGGR